jgi:hypothetical protein
MAYKTMTLQIPMGSSEVENTRMAYKTMTLQILFTTSDYTIGIGKVIDL